MDFYNMCKQMQENHLCRMNWMSFIIVRCNNIFDMLDAADNATLLESIILSVVAAVPLLGSCLLGIGSISLIYGYAIMFDFLRCLGHCNVEIFSHDLFETLPFLRYLIYTPTYVVNVCLTLSAKYSHGIYWIRNTWTWLCKEANSQDLLARCV